MNHVIGTVSFLKRRNNPRYQRRRFRDVMARYSLMFRHLRCSLHIFPLRLKMCFARMSQCPCSQRLAILMRSRFSFSVNVWRLCRCWGSSSTSEYPDESVLPPLSVWAFMVLKGGNGAVPIAKMDCVDRRQDVLTVSRGRLFVSKLLSHEKESWREHEVVVVIAMVSTSYHSRGSSSNPSALCVMELVEDDRRRRFKIRNDVSCKSSSELQPPSSYWISRSSTQNANGELR